MRGRRVIQLTYCDPVLSPAAKVARDRELSELKAARQAAAEERRRLERDRVREIRLEVDRQLVAAGGTCRVCGARLEVAQSIRAGIGPQCAKHAR